MEDLPILKPVSKEEEIADAESEVQDSIKAINDAVETIKDANKEFVWAYNEHEKAVDRLMKLKTN